MELYNRWVKMYNYLVISFCKRFKLICFEIYLNLKNSVFYNMHIQITIYNILLLYFLQIWCLNFNDFLGEIVDAAND